jgi:hypothetical protein
MFDRRKIDSRCTSLYLNVDLFSQHVSTSILNLFTTTKVVSSNHAYGMYSIQPYVIKFVDYLRGVGSFLSVLRFPPPIKLKYC